MLSAQPSHLHQRLPINWPPAALKQPWVDKTSWLLAVEEQKRHLWSAAG
jgi:hypothetical protein